jgi:hypothetical protein
MFTLPQRALAIIRDYSKPLTRPDWRNGAIYNNLFKYHPIMIETFDVLQRRVTSYNNYLTLSDLILHVGDEEVFGMYPYYIHYNNFYFYLCNEDNAFLNNERILNETHKVYYVRRVIEIMQEYKVTVISVEIK